ncbi:MAG: flagellar biosynthesis protein FlgI [Sulfitobacter sp.]
MTLRKKFRFGERPQTDTKAEAPIGLTAEDEANLDAYVDKIQETVAILRKEITAINNGELEVISNVFDEKSKILKWLELRTPLVEPFLNHDIARKLKIKEHLGDLKKYIEEDGAMLSRMAVAARTILREVEKISNRNELSDLYGKSGKKMNAHSGAKMGIDREF